MPILQMLTSLFALLTGRLSFPEENYGQTVTMDDGKTFDIIRHMKLSPIGIDDSGVVLIIRFKFKRFSHRVNKQLSKIPMLMIAGSPGFRDKLWMLDKASGYWQGVYQWKNKESVHKYMRSFVLKLMNRRAKCESITYDVIENIQLNEFVQKRVNNGVS